MGKKIDETGNSYGRLVVMEEVGRNKQGAVTWLCLCACGKGTIVPGIRLRNGKTESCGCKQRDSVITRNTKHGMSGTPIYKVWQEMVKRCNNKNSTRYAYYGGRGIEVCDEWLNFEQFFTDMGEKPEGLSLERVDNGLGYFPKNVVWASHIVQSNNKRNNRKITFRGRTQTLAQWAREIGVNYGTLTSRLNDLGWSVERTLTESAHIGKNQHYLAFGAQATLSDD